MLVAEQLGVKTGDTLPVGDRTLDVVGTYHAGQFFVDGGAIIDLRQAQRLVQRPGEVTTIAVQIAAALGAHVIGTASPKNHGFVRDAGAAEVLDYSAGPIGEQLGEPVDAVFDLVGGETLTDAAKQVRDPSRIVSIVDSSNTDCALSVTGP